MLVWLQRHPTARQHCCANVPEIPLGATLPAFQCPAECVSGAEKIHQFGQDKQKVKPEDLKRKFRACVVLAAEGECILNLFFPMPLTHASLLGDAPWFNNMNRKERERERDGELLFPSHKAWFLCQSRCLGIVLLLWRVSGPELWALFEA